MIFDDHIDLTAHEIRNFVLQQLAAAPSTPTTGRVYGDSTTLRPQYFDGTVFKAFLLVGDVVASGDVSQTSNSGSAGRLKISAGANKTIQDYAGGAGLIKVDASGVASTATAGTDYVTGASTNTLTNKTFDANATGNTLSNVEVADFAAGVVNATTTLTGATNSQIPTALAAKTYIDNAFAANDALVFKGGIDASTNPNFPAADAGHLYRITVAGLIGGGAGVVVQVGDTIMCTTDGTAAGTQAAVGANWVVTQANVDQATTAVQGFTRYATQAETEAKAVANAAVTPAGLVGFGRVQEFLFGDGAATSFTITHNLGKKIVLSQVRLVSTDEVRYPKIVNATANTLTISGYLVAPTLNSMAIVVVG